MVPTAAAEAALRTTFSEEDGVTVDGLNGFATHAGRAAGLPF